MTPSAHKTTRPLLAALALCLLAASLAPSASAQINEAMPDELDGVGVDEKLGAEVPLDLKFRDERGRVVRLADLFDGDRPVLLSLNYSGCPMLCRVQLNGLVAVLKEMKWTTGQEFDVVSVSIDPLETPAQANLTKQRYVKEYGRPGGAGGWKFLTGPEANIRKLADAVGFRYKYVESRQEYAHTAALMVCSPDGVVSRYLYGVMFDPQTVRLSLVEASEGKVGSTVDRILLFCFHYDETEGRYGPVARNIMSAGGAVTVMVLGLLLAPYWLRRTPPDGAAAIDQNADQTSPAQTSPAQSSPEVGAA